MEPSACWLFSRMAMIARLMAIAEAYPDVHQVLDYNQALGSAREFTDRVLAAFQKRAKKKSAEPSKKARQR